MTPPLLQHSMVVKKFADQLRKDKTMRLSPCLRHFEFLRGAIRFESPHTAVGH